MKVIFLDIDGVLNGYNRRLHIIGSICMKIKPLKDLWFRWDLFGVRRKYVRNLNRIIKATNAKVVISSSWRGGWYIPYNKCNPRMKSLKDQFYHYKIDVVGVTPKILDSKREDEINEWLAKTDYTIDNFVILDDESFDLQSFVGNHLVKTSNVKEGKMITGTSLENSGLKMKHVRQAIKILNS